VSDGATADPGKGADDPFAGSRDGLLAGGAGVAVVVAVHLAVLLVFPTGPGLAAVAAIEGFVALVVAGGLALAGERPRWALAGGLVVTGGALGAWFAAGVLGVVPVALGVVVVASLLSYGIHRYEMLVLGLLEESS